jgi:hypothetical protein
MIHHRDTEGTENTGQDLQDEQEKSYCDIRIV